MSFTIYKTFPKTLKFTSSNSHYSLGSTISDIKYVYSKSSGYIHYHVSSDTEPNANQGLSAGSILQTGLYQLGTTTNMNSVAFSSNTNLGSIDTTVEFYVSNDVDKIELTESNQNAPTSLVVQETYPNSKEYTLLDGSFVTYKSNIKHKIVVGFEYLPVGTLEDLQKLSKSTVIVVPEIENSAGVSPFEDIAYVCNWQGSSLKFEYANPYKKAGYKGQISFLEV